MIPSLPNEQLIASAPWNDHSADPIHDIQNAIERLDNLPVRLNMNKKTFRYLTDFMTTVGLKVDLTNPKVHGIPINISNEIDHVILEGKTNWVVIDDVLE